MKRVQKNIAIQSILMSPLTNASKRRPKLEQQYAVVTHSDLQVHNIYNELKLVESGRQRDDKSAGVAVGSDSGGAGGGITRSECGSYVGRRGRRLLVRFTRAAGRHSFQSLNRPSPRGGGSHSDLTSSPPSGTWLNGEVETLRVNSAGGGTEIHPAKRWRRSCHVLDVTASTRPLGRY